MSSGFVSGGTTEQPTERDEQWLKAQQELEDKRRRKAGEGKQEGGKSLYEILQQNKAAKQEAFEESIKLKNQFRTLDEDEVEYLDSILESTRAQEAALKKETMEQLEAFHRQRQQADKAFLDDAGTAGTGDRAGAGSPPEEEQWATTGRKRRRGKEKDAFPGVKLRKGSSTDAKATAGEPGKKTTPKKESPPVPKEVPGEAHTDDGIDKTESPAQNTKSPGPKPAAAGGSSALGLGAYSSDED